MWERALAKILSKPADDSDFKEWAAKELKDAKGLWTRSVCEQDYEGSFGSFLWETLDMLKRMPQEDKATLHSIATDRHADFPAIVARGAGRGRGRGRGRGARGGGARGGRG